MWPHFPNSSHSGHPGLPSGSCPCLWEASVGSHICYRSQDTTSPLSLVCLRSRIYICWSFSLCHSALSPSKAESDCFCNLSAQHSTWHTERLNTHLLGDCARNRTKQPSYFNHQKRSQKTFKGQGNGGKAGIRDLGEESWYLLFQYYVHKRSVSNSTTKSTISRDNCSDNTGT